MHFGLHQTCKIKAGGQIRHGKQRVAIGCRHAQILQAQLQRKPLIKMHKDLPKLQVLALHLSVDRGLDPLAQPIGGRHIALA